jgi:glycosyltransferase involved in cell wall biosynthesis
VLDQITPVILTYNEAPNIGRTLERLDWAREVVVVDSRSDDATRDIVGRHRNAKLFERTFDAHAAQWTYAAFETGIATEWILALDADYVLSDELIAELRTLAPPPDVSGYRASFVYCIEGKPLRSTVYPPVVVLWRKSRAHYAQDGHTQRIQVDGRVLDLSGRIYHDDRKSMRHWLAAQARYMQIEAEKLRAAPRGGLKVALRKAILIMPPAMFLYCMLVKGNILDGRAGLLYAMQRTLAEAMLSLYLLESAILRRK